MALEERYVPSKLILSLARKGLQKLPADLLERVAKDGIIELDLSNNRLPVALPELSRLKTTSLVTIDLTGNSFSELPLEITQLTRLKSLTLKHNHIKSLPEKFCELSSLEELNLSGNQLQQFPEPILSLHNLTFLHLGGNRLQTLPPGIKTLSKLIYLYLGGNRLHHIPPEIGSLTNLSALILCGNQLQYLPRELNKLVNLRALQLHDNQLQTLPPGTVQLDTLEELSLRNNPLVLRFVREWSDSVPSLLELSGRVAKRYKLQYDPSTIPETLCDFLDSCLTCDNPTCEGVYFLHKVRRVKFVDFCGKYRVPLMQYLCSSMCDDYHDDGSSTTSGSEDEADERAQNRIRKVLLG